MLWVLFGSVLSLCSNRSVLWSCKEKWRLIGFKKRSLLHIDTTISKGLWGRSPSFETGIFSRLRREDTLETFQWSGTVHRTVSTISGYGSGRITVRPCVKTCYPTTSLWMRLWRQQQSRRRTLVIDRKTVAGLLLDYIRHCLALRR